MTIRLSKSTKVWVKDLVTAYQAFNEANHRAFGKERDCGILLWGELLLHAQHRLGVDMYERQMLVDMIANAKERQAHRERAAA